MGHGKSELDLIIYLLIFVTGTTWLDLKDLEHFNLAPDQTLFFVVSNSQSLMEYAFYTFAVQK